MPRRHGSLFPPPSRLAPSSPLVSLRRKNQLTSEDGLELCPTSPPSTQCLNRSAFLKQLGHQMVFNMPQAFTRKTRSLKFLGGQCRFSFKLPHGLFNTPQAFTRKTQSLKSLGWHQRPPMMQASSSVAFLLPPTNMRSRARHRANILSHTGSRKPVSARVRPHGYESSPTKFCGTNPPVFPGYRVNDDSPPPTDKTLPAHRRIRSADRLDPLRPYGTEAQRRARGHSKDDKACGTTQTAERSSMFGAAVAQLSISCPHIDSTASPGRNERGSWLVSKILEIPRGLTLFNSEFVLLLCPFRLSDHFANGHLHPLSHTNRSNSKVRILALELVQK
ncbi:hypothetical protein C8R45DRAFT_1156045 [Mycena sanguinolenta]|nr:hypothetical protein C8R45DRAFT_1156045 [Mycena sanguinolenta]